jgi:hypothetical protein
MARIELASTKPTISASTSLVHTLISQSKAPMYRILKTLVKPEAYPKYI